MYLATASPGWRQNVTVGRCPGCEWCLTAVRGKGSRRGGWGWISRQRSGGSAKGITVHPEAVLLASRSCAAGRRPRDRCMGRQSRLKVQMPQLSIKFDPPLARPPRRPRIGASGRRARSSRCARANRAGPRSFRTPAPRRARQLAPASASGPGLPPAPCRFRVSPAPDCRPPTASRSPHCTWASTVRPASAGRAAPTPTPGAAAQPRRRRCRRRRHRRRCCHGLH